MVLLLFLLLVGLTIYDKAYPATMEKLGDAKHSSLSSHATSAWMEKNLRRLPGLLKGSCAITPRRENDCLMDRYGARLTPGGTEAYRITSAGPDTTRWRGQG